MRVEVSRLQWVLEGADLGKLFAALGFAQGQNISVSCDINGTRILEQDVDAYTDAG